MMKYKCKESFLWFILKTQTEISAERRPWKKTLLTNMPVVLKLFSFVCLRKIHQQFRCEKVFMVCPVVGWMARAPLRKDKIYSLHKDIIEYENTERGLTVYTQPVLKASSVFFVKDVCDILEERDKQNSKTKRTAASQGDEEEAAPWRTSHITSGSRSRTRHLFVAFAKDIINSTSPGSSCKANRSEAFRASLPSSAAACL